MDVSSSPHPTDETLRSFVRGLLDEASAAAISTHIEQCGACKARVARLSSDRLIDSLCDVHPPQDQTRTYVSPGDGAKKPLETLLVDSVAPGLAAHPDYQIKRELGRGGVGVVFLAHNTLLGRDEVLKVIGRHIMERPGMLDRFLREMRVVAQLRHPNIVTAYSAFRLEETLVFAMEYVQGRDLAKIIKVNGPLPVVQASNLAYQAALGLQHAHEEGLVHRDIKPNNLMLQIKGKAATLKVLDFGLAKVTREETVDTSLTSQGQALGTPDFIAPEQIADAKRADIRADIYSLGCTLYYFLTSRPPFVAASVYDIFQAHLSRDPDPLDLVRPEVPAELAALVARMMAKDPAQRFQTPAEVAQSLAPFFRKARSASTDRTTEFSRADATHPPSSNAPKPGGAAARAIESTVADAQWENLIDFREKPPEGDEGPLEAPEPGPLWARWPILLASSLFGLVALGLLAFITTRPGKPTETRPGALISAPKPRNLPSPASKPGEPPESQASLTTPHRTVVLNTAAVSDPAPEASEAPTGGVRSDEKPRPAPAANLSTTEAEALRRATQLVYTDDFSDTRTGWPRGDGNKGYENGFYFVENPISHWRPLRRIQAESTLEVVGHLRPRNRGVLEAWGVFLRRLTGPADSRGFVVKINSKGELFVAPSFFPDAKAFLNVDPSVGPIVHPAIKPGDQPNTLLLVIKKRCLEIFVNSVRVCDPIDSSFDLVPIAFELGVFDGLPTTRAEFDQIAIREFLNDKAPVVPTPDDSLRTGTHLVYTDEFGDPKSGWARGETKGYADGAYFISSPGYWRAPRLIHKESTLEVVGRVKSETPDSRATWGVVVSRATGPADRRGFVVELNGKGQLFIRPSLYPEAESFLNVDPDVGPIVHPAIKSGDQFNTLLLVIKKRSLEILVNAARVCEPLSFDFDMVPSYLNLTSHNSSLSARGEFDRIEVREFRNGGPPLSSTRFSSLRPSTRHYYEDDFNDPASGWPRSESHGYSAGLYFVTPVGGRRGMKGPPVLRTDSVLEVTGRLNSLQSSTQGAWSVVVLREMGGATRGFMVKITGKGELWLTPDPWPHADEYREIDPQIGPIVHPMIKPAAKANTLDLVIRKRSLEIFVNSVLVCEPILYDFDLTPAKVELCAFDGPGQFRAEFESVLIREFVRPERTKR